MERSRRDGDILRAMVIHCLREAHARPDLTELERVDIEETQAEIKTILDTFRLVSPPSPLVEGAFRMTAAVMDLALYARLKPEEIRAIRLQAVIDHAREVGSTPKKERPPRAYATLIALALPKAVCDLPDGKVADKIEDAWKGQTLPRWKGPKPPPLEHDTIAKLVGKLRKEGKIPRRRPRPQRG